MSSRRASEHHHGRTPSAKNLNVIVQHARSIRNHHLITTITLSHRHNHRLPPPRLSHATWDCCSIEHCSATIARVSGSNRSRLGRPHHHPSRHLPPSPSPPARDPSSNSCIEQNFLASGYRKRRGSQPRPLLVQLSFNSQQPRRLKSTFNVSHLRHPSLTGRLGIIVWVDPLQP